MEPFAVRGFNPCESLLRHSPEQLRTFIRRMKTLRMNTIIIHYDYGWTRYKDIILEECRKAGIDIILMTFGPRTFYGLTGWKTQWFAKNEEGKPWFTEPACELHPCAFEPEAREAFRAGAVKWLKSLPPEIKHVHMRAGDGIYFCKCEKCRDLPEYEKWQPFVDIFTEAVLSCRPDLKFETDVYYGRYRIPEHHDAFHKMSSIMYDTFYRHPFYELGSCRDTVNTELMQYADPQHIGDAVTPCDFHLKRLREWTKTFPEKVYIHENCMGQSYCGVFQRGTGAYLKDLRLYRELGVQGVCYEAYEPGYASFERNFRILADAMYDLDSVSYEPSELEKILPETGMKLFCTDPAFPLEKYLSDPIELQQVKYYRAFQTGLTPEIFRNYLSFYIEHQERFDPLFTAFFMAKWGKLYHQLSFDGLSERTLDMLSYQKLWDFMEKIPLSEDPREVTLECCRDLLEKVREYRN